MSDGKQRARGRWYAYAHCEVQGASPLAFLATPDREAARKRRRKERASARACEAFRSADLAVAMSMPLVEARRVWRAAR
jgi:hypothetical protein